MIRSTRPVLAVWGLGSIGLRHCSNALAAGAGVVGFDPDAGRRQLAVERGCRVAADRSATLAEADAVVVCSPTALHRDDLETALAAGRHVFVEKPIAHDPAGLDAVLADARRRGLRVAVGFNLRFHAVVAAARAIVADGRAGRVLWARFIGSSYLPEWRPQQDYRAGYAADPRTGGVLFDYSHEIDLALHLVGPADVAAATAVATGRLAIAAEDLAVLCLRHAGGAVTGIHVDFATRPPRRSFEIAGDRGVLEGDLLARTLRFTAEDGSMIDDRHCEGDFDRDYRAEMAAFLALLDGRPTAIADGADGLAALHVIVAARRAAGLPT